MGSALETLCGQAVGAGQVDMLGVYIQRSWIICGATALALAPTYVFTAPILRALHQPTAISAVAGRYTRLVVPQLFAYAANFPLQKFFQAQSKVWAMTFISGAGLALHIALNYLFVTRLGHGLFGAAMIGNVTWWIIIVAQFAYLVSGCFPEAWKGFSVLAFNNLTAFVKLSLASAVMLCLELWYYSAVLILVGLLKNAQLQHQLPALDPYGGNRLQCSSVAIGAGWQTLVAFINIVCYYLFGIPLGVLFGFKLKLGALGIWVGMSIGTLLQTAILIIICFRAKWENQAMLAEERIKKWGGSSETLPAATTTATNNIIDQ
uniref:Protein TRANSPARENT TESTA 12 n=1 Tax=Aegilops tauschii TaxID=37682 RepID=R7W2C9_AEGTA